MSTKFKVFKEKETEEEVKEVYFKLVQECASISLMACNKHGKVYNNGCILQILASGKLNICEGVNRATGLTLDSTRRVVVVK